MAKRWVGVDVGTARVGLALSDESNSFALPHATAPAKDAIADIVTLCAQHEAGVVVGWPLEMSGREGRATQRVANFLQRLEQAAQSAGLELDVRRRDERLTTGLAEALLSEASIYGKKRKQVVDQVAAVQILQGFLEETKGDGEED